ncbi:MAG: hypothetical protein AB7G80_03785 [Dongiaceae bacterium]
MFFNRDFTIDTVLGADNPSQGLTNDNLVDKTKEIGAKIEEFIAKGMFAELTVLLMAVQDTALIAALEPKHVKQLLPALVKTDYGSILTDIFSIISNRPNLMEVVTPEQFAATVKLQIEQGEAPGFAAMMELGKRYERLLVGLAPEEFDQAFTNVYRSGCSGYRFGNEFDRYVSFPQLLIELKKRPPLAEKFYAVVARERARQAAR